MKKISLNKASKIYDELKLYKNLGNIVCLFIHDENLKIGYNNRFGVSDFIKNDERRFLILNECKTSILLEDFCKKDVVKIIQVLVNEAIELYGRMWD